MMDETGPLEHVHCLVKLIFAIISLLLSDSCFDQTDHSPFLPTLSVPNYLYSINVPRLPSHTEAHALPVHPA